MEPRPRPRFRLRGGASGGIEAVISGTFSGAVLTEGRQTSTLCTWPVSTGVATGAAAISTFRTGTSPELRPFGSGSSWPAALPAAAWSAALLCVLATGGGAPAFSIDFTAFSGGSASALGAGMPLGALGRWQSVGAAFFGTAASAEGSEGTLFCLGSSASAAATWAGLCLSAWTLWAAAASAGTSDGAGTCSSPACGALAVSTSAAGAVACSCVAGTATGGWAACSALGGSACDSEWAAAASSSECSTT
jgi:hypothetical protein